MNEEKKIAQLQWLEGIIIVILTIGLLAFINLFM
jgi:hypothetical protein